MNEEKLKEWLEGQIKKIDKKTALRENKWFKGERYAYRLVLQILIRDSNDSIQHNQRYELAKAAMEGMLKNHTLGGNLSATLVADFAVMVADEMIKQLSIENELIVNAEAKIKELEFEAMERRADAQEVEDENKKLLDEVECLQFKLSQLNAEKK